ncbi:MAG TPA: hypothetical protein VJT71_06165 [Pyrinomonadaceae bacterium]|nr:hypothetical protein [Pyrinomonadaceae bacterium]
MIDHRLKSISASAVAALPEDSHLDEDAISAFVEGRLGTVESRPVLSHLTACSTCRRASADLVRLENQIDAESEPMQEPEETGRLQAFLSNLQSLVPDGSDEVVFAYQNPDEEEEPADPAANPDEKPSPDKS